MVFTIMCVFVCVFICFPPVENTVATRSRSHKQRDQRTHARLQSGIPNIQILVELSDRVCVCVCVCCGECVRTCVSMSTNGEEFCERTRCRTDASKPTRASRRVEEENRQRKCHKNHCILRVLTVVCKYVCTNTPYYMLRFICRRSFCASWASSVGEKVL